MVAQVELVQTFVNPFSQPLEAVYVFPLSHQAGINGMRLEIGERRIVGALLKRDDAQRVYERARKDGKTTSLLDQERPNIFTQRVGNISPGAEVRVHISYVESLSFDDGAYGFHVPLVVGPRYIPGAAISGVAAQDPSLAGVTVPLAVPTAAGVPSGSGWSPDTDRVADASRITPPILKSGLRTGHEVSIRVHLDAGIAIRDLACPSHQVVIERPDASTADIRLQAGDAIPNKDFVLRYAVAGNTPEVSAVTHVGADGGWLQLILQPARMAEVLAERRPRDLCFLIDVSGSMSGEPLAKVREAMREMLALAGPQDRVQIITFASRTNELFPDYMQVTPAVIAQALALTQSQQAGGSTEMLKGVRAVLDRPLDRERMRMVVMLTDGFIGNEKEIIGAIGTKGNERLRFWCIGIGSAPNRYLVDGVADSGGGMGVVLGLGDDARACAAGLMQRMQHAQLEQVTIDWGGLPVSEVVPARLPALWPGRPVSMCARFNGPASGTVTVHGEVDGRPLAIPLHLNLPGTAPANRAVRTLWARQRLGELRLQDTVGAGYDLPAAITDLSLRYGVMSEFTSFVAVDERVINAGGANRQVNVAVPLPAGVTMNALPVITAEMESAIPVSCAETLGDAEVGGASTLTAIGASSGGGMFSNRTGGGRKRAVATGGGSKASESSNSMGLRFLNQHQAPDGSWDPVTYPQQCQAEPRCEPGQGGRDDTVAITAQALLVFLGQGYDHKTPNRYRPTMQRGFWWLRAQQAPDGTVGKTVESQALAAAALAEAFAMTADPELRRPAQAAIDRLLALRIAGADGRVLAWGRATTVVTSDTCAALFALHSAHVAGLVIGDGLERAKVWLEAAWQAANPGYASLDAALGTSVFPATWSPNSCSGEESEAGAMAAVLLGKHLGDPLLETLATTIATRAQELVRTDLRRLRLAGHVQYMIGGERWKIWNQTARDALVQAQRSGTECFAGSWDPRPELGGEHARGRLQATIWAELHLEIYYAYSRLGRSTKKP